MFQTERCESFVCLCSFLKVQFCLNRLIYMSTLFRGNVTVYFNEEKGETSGEGKKVTRLRYCRECREREGEGCEESLKECEVVCVCLDGVVCVCRTAET